MTTKKFFSLAFVLLVTSIGAKAANQTLNSGVTAYASASPFSGLTSGDTIIVHGTFVMDVHYTNYSANTMVIIIDGSGSAIHWNANTHLTIGSGSKILISNGGNLTNTGSCNTNRSIVFGSLTVGSCNGAGQAASFAEIVAAGGIGSDGDPLPVTWLNVDAKEVAGNLVEVKWSTASEENNSHFEIEYSIDGENWMLAGIVASHSTDGMSQEILNYNYTHSLAEAASSIYYRIKQIDYNNASDYSNILRVQLQEVKKLNIATLGNNKISVNTLNENDGMTTIKVYDLSGKEVYSTNESSAVIVLDQPGVYVIELLDNYNTERVKHLVR